MLTHGPDASCHIETLRGLGPESPGEKERQETGHYRSEADECPIVPVKRLEMEQAVQAWDLDQRDGGHQCGDEDDTRSARAEPADGRSDAGRSDRVRPQ